MQGAGGAYTPVPGGVGPLTIAMLMANTVSSPNGHLCLRCVGLTGGLASGKTFVGHALADLGCYLIEADELGHQVMLPGGEAYDAVILREFGQRHPGSRRPHRPPQACSAIVWHNPSAWRSSTAWSIPPVASAKTAAWPRSPPADPLRS